MTPDEKELLIRDLCERLPYGVIMNVTEPGDDSVNFNCFLGPDIIKEMVSETSHFKYRPYLRPMSSMTREEMSQMKADTCPFGTGTFDSQYLCCPMSHFGEMISYTFMHDILVWLRKHHFDFMGLIEKGLALEAPEMMYVIPLEDK